jgi:hypothetical protein
LIFPRGPLLWAAGLWVVPLNLAAVLYPAHAGACLVAMLPAFAAAAWDAWRARNRLDGLRPVFPASARYTLGRPAGLAFEMRGVVATRRDLRMTLELPSLLSPAVAIAEMRLEPGAGVWNFELAVVPERRGRTDAVRCFPA